MADTRQRNLRDLSGRSNNGLKVIFCITNGLKVINIEPGLMKEQRRDIEL